MDNEPEFDHSLDDFDFSSLGRKTDQSPLDGDASELPPCANEAEPSSDGPMPTDVAKPSVTPGAEGAASDGYRLVRELAQHGCRTHHWEKAAGQHPSHFKGALRKRHLEQHLEGGNRIGLAPIAPGTNGTRIALYDFDSHKGESSWEQMVEAVKPIIAGLRKRGLNAVPFRSSGGCGIHVIVLWDELQDAYSVRRLLDEVLHEHGLKNGVRGVAQGEVEIFPKQDSVPADGWGSMFILPLAGESCLLDVETLEPIELDDGFELPKSDPITTLDRAAPVERQQVEISTDLTELREALAKIHNDADHSLDYDEWRNVIFGIHDATGGSEEGLALAHEFSARSPKYDPEFLDGRVWPYIRSRDGGVTAATIYDMARAGDPTADLNMLDVLPQEAPSEPPKKRFQILDDLEARRNRAPLTWIIKGVLPRAELVVMYGEPGSGKSFAALDIGAAVELGNGWRGHKTKKLHMLYVAAEGAAGFLWRLEAYCQANDIESIGVDVITDAPNLHKGDDAKLLLERIKARGPVDLIILDTLAAVSPGANENASEDMGRVLATCKHLSQETGATVLLIHHSGKDATRGSRGWSGLKGAADAELEVLREGNLRQIRATKQKDGEDGEVFPFELRVVEVGHDEDGEPITSCVVKHITAGPDVPEIKPGKSASGRRGDLGSVEAIVLKCAHDLAELGGDGIPMAALIDATYTTVARDPEKKDMRRTNISRAITGLAAKGYVRIDDEAVFLMGKGAWRAKGLGR